MKPFPQIQTQLFLLGLGLFSFISTSAQSQEFLTFTTREVKWVIESSEFWNNPKKYIVKDKNIKPPFDSENLDIYKTIYLDEGYHIGMVVKTSEIDSIECYIEGVAVDPFRREDRKYDGKHYVIDFTNVVKQHIFAVCEGEKLKIPEIRAKVKEIAPKYLSLGGELLIRIWSKGSNDSQFFRVLPEKYGFSLFNRALPVNAQYSGSSKDKEKLGNLVNLYYSLQIILKDHDKRGFNNWTTINFFWTMSFDYNRQWG